MLLPFKSVGIFFQDNSNNTIIFLVLVQLMDLFRATKVHSMGAEAEASIRADRHQDTWHKHIMVCDFS